MKRNFDTLKQPSEITQAAAFISQDEPPQATTAPTDAPEPSKITGLDYFTVEQVMAVLQVTKRTMYNYIKAGQIDAVKIGRNWRIARPALEKFMITGTTADYLQRLKG